MALVIAWREASSSKIKYFQCNAAYLNQIEHQKRTGSAATLRAIATALDVDLLLG